MAGWNLNPVYLPLHPTPSLSPSGERRHSPEMGRVFYAPTWPLLPQFRWVVLAAAAGDSLRQLVAAQGRGW